MNHDWRFAYLLPHATLTKPVESDYLAIVSADEPRLQAIRKTQPNVEKLITSFTDQFGREVKPSALLIRSDRPSGVDFYAVVCFRNLVALGVVIEASIRKHSGKKANNAHWSDYFDFYSFTADTDGRDLVARSVDNLAIDHADEFRGQTVPYLPAASSLSFHLDQNLLVPCLTEWEQHFAKSRPSWKSKKLFRSLETACQASRLPAVGTRTPTIHDIGIAVSLWVSALEILCHPKTGNANRATVLAHLETIPWQASSLRAKRYTLKTNTGKTFNVNGTVVRFNYIQKLCGELYRVRNDFLHGNPVSISTLFPAKKQTATMLLHCAPLVYRAALLAYLPAEPHGDLQSQIANWFDWNKYEKAIMGFMKGEKK